MDTQPQSQPLPRRETDRLEIMAAIAIVLIGVLFRIYHLGTFGFDIDEMVDVGLATRESILSIISDSNPPLYLFLLRFWIKFFGSSEFWVRFLPFLFSTASLILMAHIGLSGVITNRPLRLVPVVLLAFSPAAIEAAQWSRSNALWELATVLIMSGVLLEKQLLSAVGFGLSLATHWFASPVGFAVLLTRSSRSSLRRFRLPLCIAFSAAIFTLAGASLNQSSMHLNWQLMRFQYIPFRHELEIQLNAIFGHWLAALTVPVLAFALYRTSRQTNANQNNEGAWFLTVAGIFAASLLVMSFSMERSLFMMRYMSSIIPLICLGVPLAVDALLSSQGPWSVNGNIQPGARALAIVVCASMITANLWGAEQYHKRPVARWREGLKAVAASNAAIAWTTRSIEIARPYLDGSKTELRQFSGAEAELDIIARDAILLPIAVIDNFWGGLLYWEPLKERLQVNQVRFQEFTITDRTQEPIRVLITQPN